GGRGGSAFGHAFHHAMRKIEERLPCCGGFGIGGRDQRLSIIAGSANSGIESDAAQKRQSKLRRGALSAAFGKNIYFVAAMRANKKAHVLDYAENIHAQLLE